MNRNTLIDKLKLNFDVRELVCPHCYNRFGEQSWLFLSTELLSVLYTLRYEIFQKPIIINNWHNGKSYDERGLRCNMCQTVKDKKSVYLSAHCLGKAIDFSVVGLASNDVYQIVCNNLNKFIYPIRLEIGTDGWTHIDTYQPYKSEAKLIKFNA